MPPFFPVQFVWRSLFVQRRGSIDPKQSRFIVNYTSKKSPCRACARTRGFPFLFRAPNRERYIVRFTGYGRKAMLPRICKQFIVPFWNMIAISDLTGGYLDFKIGARWNTLFYGPPLFLPHRKPNSTTVNCSTPNENSSVKIVNLTFLNQ